MSSPAATGHSPAGAKARPDFERIALILQGGGALGAYQAGVYQALAEAGLHPDWVAGISIGAINSALIAGNRRSGASPGCANSGRRSRLAARHPATSPRWKRRTTRSGW